MNKKTLTILLLAVLLVGVLFFASVALAGRRPGSLRKIDLESPSTTRIAGWLSRPAKAVQLTLSSGSAEDCRLEGNRITIRAGKICVFNIPADKRWTLNLRLVQPIPQDGEITALLQQPEAYDVEQTLTPDKADRPLDIYSREKQEPATLTVRVDGSADEYVIEIVEK